MILNIFLTAIDETTPVIEVIANFYLIVYPPHIIIAVVYIFICLFPVPPIVDTALNI